MLDGGNVKQAGFVLALLLTRDTGTPGFSRRLLLIFKTALSLGQQGL